MKLTFGSLFAGIGGFDLGLERAGMIPACQVEIDDYATKILEKHWPKVTRYKDVREVGKHNLEPVDIICGGFPCQDISLAGKGEGLSGGRSGLWFEYHRIIKELQPKYAIIENVPALRGRGLDQVLRSLAEIGYDAEWHCIPACAIGAPHRRDRIWIVAYTGRITTGAKVTGLSDERNAGNEKKLRAEKGNGSTDSGEAMAYPIIKRLEGYTGDGEDVGRSEQNGSTPSQSLCGSGHSEGWWAVEPNVGRVANGVSKRVDRLKCLGNSVVPQIVECVGRQILEYEKEMS